MVSLSVVLQGQIMLIITPTLLIVVNNKKNLNLVHMVHDIYNKTQDSENGENNKNIIPTLGVLEALDS